MLSKILQEIDLFGGLGVDLRTMFEWILKKWISIRGSGLVWFGLGIIESCECDITPLGSISHGVI